MEQDTNKIETTGTGVERMYVKLKFVKSEKNGAFISFVSQNPVNGVICGVREDSPFPKKIVIIDRGISNYILPNVLYDCTLIPMTKIHNQETGEDFIPGYIAIKANVVQFKAVVTTKYVRGSKYQVEVSFGNKVIRFDPMYGRRETVKSLPACLAVLGKRCDVQDLMYVVDSFHNAAIELLEQMKQDMREIHNQKKQNEKAGRRDRH